MYKRQEVVYTQGPEGTGVEQRIGPVSYTHLDVYKRQKYRSRLRFCAGERPYLALLLKKGEDALKFGRRLVEDYAKTAPDQTEG